MKFLTLNTHSWMEENHQQKFEDLAKDILDKQYDIICFQEINQEIQSPLAPVNDLYHPTPSAEPIHQDHYVRCLVEKLEEAGLTYHGLGLIIILATIAIMKELLSFLVVRSTQVNFWYQM